jgi:hypothetical protein
MELGTSSAKEKTLWPVWLDIYQTVRFFGIDYSKLRAHFQNAVLLDIEVHFYQVFGNLKM